MRNVIEAVKTTCMWFAILVLGVSLVSFVIDISVRFLGLLLMNPVKALGYVVFAYIIGIGIFHAIDKARI